MTRDQIAALIDAAMRELVKKDKKDG